MGTLPEIYKNNTIQIILQGSRKQHGLTSSKKTSFSSENLREDLVLGKKKKQTKKQSNQPQKPKQERLLFPSSPTY